MSSICWICSMLLLPRNVAVLSEDRSVWKGAYVSPVGSIEDMSNMQLCILISTNTGSTSLSLNIALKATIIAEDEHPANNVAHMYANFFRAASKDEQTHAAWEIVCECNALDCSHTILFFSDVNIALIFVRRMYTAYIGVTIFIFMYQYYFLTHEHYTCEFLKYEYDRKGILM